MLILLGLFSGIAMLLTIAGISGTMVYLLSERRREIGFRLALGATDSAIIRTAAVRQLIYVAVGLCGGVAIAATLSQLGGAALFGLSGTYWSFYALAPAIVLVVGVAANYFTAKRMLRSSVYDVLRQQ